MAYIEHHLLKSIVLLTSGMLLSLIPPAYSKIHHTTNNILHHNLQSQDKRLKLSLNGNRKVVGQLRGYDAFLNVVLEDAETAEGENIGTIVIRGNSIIQFESVDRIQTS